MYNSKITLLILMLPMVIFGQKYHLKKAGGIYNTGQSTVDKGWYVGLGLTYMWAYNKETAEFTLIDTIGAGPDITYNDKYIGDPYGTFGLFAELGKFTMNDKKLINYTDYGIAYRWYRGGESYEDEGLVNGIRTRVTNIEGSYSDQNLSAHLNIGYRFDRSSDLFYVNGLGLNADFALIKSRNRTIPIPGKDYTEGPSFLAEMHYFFGIGFKTGKRLIVMPVFETPIFSILPFNHIISTHSYFNSRSRPFILRVRFMLLKKDSKSCPPVFNPMGIDPKGNGQK